MRYPLKKKITTFVAIELPENIRERLVMVQKELKELDYPVVWELPEKLHITLVYWGRINEAETKIAIRSLRRLVESFEVINVKLQYLSYFFQRHGTGTVWMGVESGGRLKDIRKQIVRDLNKRGFSLSGKKFVGHITLGKLKKMRNDEQKRVLDGLMERDYLDVGSFEVKEFTVMTSSFQKVKNTTEYEAIERVRIG